MTKEVTDFPHPDSPTRPMICLSLTFKSTEWRASIGPSSVSKWTLSPSTSSTFSDNFSSPVLGIDDIPDSVTKQVEAEDRHSDCQPRI